MVSVATYPGGNDRANEVSIGVIRPRVIPGVDNDLRCGCKAGCLGSESRMSDFSNICSART